MTGCRSKASPGHGTLWLSGREAGCIALLPLQSGSKAMRRVITYGTFDTLHYGHIRLLRRARALGDYLIVALSTDGFNEIKGKQARFSWDDRRSDLEAVRFVDQVIPEETWEQKLEDVKRHDVHVFTMGDDWEGKFDFLRPHCDVVYLPRTPDISSTMIRKKIETP
jgi:glycerol-3-phosphate cytidylyltransferase